MRAAMENRSCVFTVIYPGSEVFFPDFFSSLKDQKDSAFDLFMLNDGMVDVKHHLEEFHGNVIEIPVTGSITAIREQAIQLLVESNYDHIIFADADDYFSPNRVKKSIEMLEKADIYVNDISTVSGNGDLIEEKYFSKRLENGTQLDIGFLVDKNIIGLGNTAIRREALTGIEIPENIKSVDWFLFTDRLLDNKKTFFSNDAITFYRQHEANTIGIGSTADKERIMKGIEAHYWNSVSFASVSDLHRTHLAKINKVQEYVSESKSNLESYLEKVREKINPFPFWWEEVKTLDEL